MQVTTELRPLFSYSILYIVFTIILIIFVLILTKYMKKKELQKELAIPSHKDLLVIKRKYLAKIDELINNFNSKKLSSRKAYQELSSIIRNFIFEVTNIQVQNYTLKDIASINMPVLYQLVSEYYSPEFARISKGNIALSISKTRMVIEKWN